MDEARHRITVIVNGVERRAAVTARMTLVDCLREVWDLTGSHVGCEHGVCGACTVLLDDDPVRSCLVLAVQADGMRVTTIEGVADGERLHPVQRAFQECHGLQCGFCTPGMVLIALHLLREHPDPGDAEIREALSGNLCMCTGYQNIVKSVRRAAELLGAGARP